jgi:hypothetical protein
MLEQVEDGGEKRDVESMYTFFKKSEIDLNYERGEISPLWRKELARCVSGGMAGINTAHRSCKEYFREKNRLDGP